MSARPVPELLGRIVAFEAQGPVLDPATLATALGLTAEQLRTALSDHVVYSVVERGEGEDAGRHRLRLRHRATEVVLVVDADGRVIEAMRSGPPGADRA